MRFLWFETRFAYVRLLVTFVALAVTLAPAYKGQTSPTAIDMARQGKNPDFSAMPITRPISIGPSLPNTCILGQMFFNTSAVPGSNVYSCTRSNTWTVVGAGVSSLNAELIQGVTVAGTPPINNQILVYYTGTGMYIPTSIYSLQNGLGTSAVGLTSLQVNVSMSIRSVTSTSDTIVSTDCGGLVTYNSSAAVTVVLPQASLGGNFLAGCPVTLHNYGAGVVTVTSGVSTIGNSSSQVVNQNKGCLLVSDGTNWQLGNCN